MYGVLTGVAFALHLNTLENLTAEQNLGQVFSACRTDLFLPADQFARRMAEILKMLKAAVPAPGVPRVLAPAELEFATVSRNRKLCILMPEEVVKQLVDLGNQVGLDFPSLHPACA